MKGLILTYIITATASVSALRYPLIGLYVYVGLAILRPQSIFGFAGDLSNLSLIVGVALIIGWALKGFGSWRFGRGRPIVLSLLAFTAWFALSAALALNTTRSFEQIVVWLKLVVPFLVGVTMLEGDKRWRPMLWTIVLAQGYVGFEMNLNYLYKGYNAAADGFGGMDNNCFGVSLLCVIGPAIALVLLSKTWSARALAAVAAGLILHTILLTFSRGALVGLIAVAVTAFVMMPKRPKYLGAVVVAVLLVVRFTGPQLAARYATTFAPSGERDWSSQSRIDLWQDCFTVIEAYPVFGVGPANWKVIASNYGWPEGKSAHSVWMETAAEIGLPGVLAMMVFFGCAAVRLWPIARARQTDANRYDIALATGVVLTIVGFAVGGLFVSVPSLEVPYYVTMIGVAMLKTHGLATTAPAALPVVRVPSPDHSPVSPSSRHRSTTAADGSPTGGVDRTSHGQRRFGRSTARKSKTS